MSPVQAPQPVIETNNIVSGKPTAPLNNLDKPLPFSHGSTPISNPTLAVNIPPKPNYISNYD